MEAGQLLERLKTVCPAVASVRIGDEGDPETWEFTAPGASAPQISAAQAIIDAGGEIPPAPPIVPQQVSARQLRLVLLAEGKLHLVEPSINALPVEQRDAALIEWEYSVFYDRSNPLIANLGAAFGYSPEQIDSLFLAAAAL